MILNGEETLGKEKRARRGVTGGDSGATPGKVRGRRSGLTKLALAVSPKGFMEPLKIPGLQQI